MSSFSSLVRALELKSKFDQLSQKDKGSFSALTPETANMLSKFEIISSAKAKQIASDFMKVYSLETAK